MTTLCFLAALHMYSHPEENVEDLTPDPGNERKDLISDPEKNDQSLIIFQGKGKWKHGICAILTNILPEDEIKKLVEPVAQNRNLWGKNRIRNAWVTMCLRKLKKIKSEKSGSSLEAPSKLGHQEKQVSNTNLSEKRHKIPLFGSVFRKRPPTESRIQELFSKFRDVVSKIFEKPVSTPQKSRNRRQVDPSEAAMLGAPGVTRNHKSGKPTMIAVGVLVGFFLVAAIIGSILMAKKPQIYIAPDEYDPRIPREPEPGEKKWWKCCCD